jgi:hypothetical protein
MTRQLMQTGYEIRCHGAVSNRSLHIARDERSHYVRTADRFVDISIDGRSNEQSAGFNIKDDSLSDTNDTLISSKVSFISPA